MATPDTNDTPLQLALEPDWSLGVEFDVQYSTSVNRSWAGRDQSQRNREKGLLGMRYSISGLTPAQAKARIQTLRTESRQPIMGPVWPDGVPTQATISGVGAVSVQLAQNPVHDWEGIDTVWIWDRANGGEFRTVTAISGRTITLSGTGTAYLAGAFVFPCKVMVRNVSDSGLSPINLEAGNESVEYQIL